MEDPAMYLKPKDETFAKFVWNSEKKEFLGRTGESWAKIGFFYVIFYACLAAFFAATMAVFYQTLDTDKNPTYTPGQGSILRNPALGFRPRPPKENIESTLIWYKNGNASDIKHWVEELDTFIGDYDGRTDDGQDSRDCDFEKHRDDMKLPPAQRDERSCLFDQTDLGGYCTKANSWGYNRDSPCVLLKLNKMIGWVPEVYTNVSELPAHMPLRLKNIIKNETKVSGFNRTVIPPMVWVSCEGENPADQEYLTDVIFTPYAGFPAYYFPYRKNAAYRSPLVAVKFEKPQPNVLINIECRLWAKNINHVKQDRLGMVHFELLID